MADQAVVTYEPPGSVARDFLRSEAFVRGIMGPIGSGKSTACVIEILRRAALQAPGPDGKRHSRWAIIRNSYPELRTTTVKTWQQWVPLIFGRMTMDSPIRHVISTDVLEIEVLFLALDRDEDARKLLSLELTGAWLNEAREIPKSILDALTGRVGRYPSKAMGGVTWSGIIMDTNPPDTESWWYKLAEDSTPSEFEFFKQPAGDHQDAENIPNLPHRYYERAKAGKDEDWIKVYVRGEYGFVMDGKPVFSMFRDRTHVAPERLKPVGGLPLLIGADFGLTPAAVIGQKLPDGRWFIIDELVTEDCGIIRFAEILAAYAAKHYPDHNVDAGFGDPAGNQRAQTDERTALDIMRQYTSWKWRPAPTNDFTMRKEVVSAALNRMVDGNPGFQLSPNCAKLRKGFAGGYQYKAVASANGATFHEKPNKNDYSHIADALQYLLLGGGEHQVVLGRVRRNAGPRRRTAIGMDYDPLDRDGESKPRRSARNVDYDVFG
jgi:hypothetical protein